VGALRLWIPNCIMNSWMASSASTRGCPYFSVYIMNFRCANFAFRKKNDMSVFLIISYIRDSSFMAMILHFSVRVSLSCICFIPFLLFSFCCCDTSFCLASGLYQLPRYSVCYCLYLYINYQIFTVVNFSSKIQTFRVITFISHFFFSWRYNPQWGLYFTAL